MSEIAYETPIEEGFVIDTDAKAEWALKKIKEAREDCERWVAWYKEQIKKMEEQTAFNTMNLEHMLAAYFQTVPHKSTKTQESYALPGGKLVLKKQNAEYKRDDKAVIEWLKANGGEQFVNITEGLDWAGLKAKSAVVGGKLFDENGEEIPGVEVIEREAKFVVEV